MSTCCGDNCNMKLADPVTVLFCVWYTEGRKQLKELKIEPGKPLEMERTQMLSLFEVLVESDLYVIMKKCPNNRYLIFVDNTLFRTR